MAPTNVRPASEDSQGDPADQEGADEDAAPEGEDEQGDAEDQEQEDNSDGSDEDAQGSDDRSQVHPATARAQQEYLQQMPADEFERGAHQAVSQMAPQQQEGLAGSLLGALQGRGVDIGQVGSALGLGSIDPQQIGPQGLSRLLGWAQQNHPDALHEAAASEPDLIQGMAGHLLSGIAGNLAGKLFGR